MVVIRPPLQANVRMMDGDACKRKMLVTLGTPLDHAAR